MMSLAASSSIALACCCQCAPPWRMRATRVRTISRGVAPMLVSRSHQSATKVRKERAISRGDLPKGICHEVTRFSISIWLVVRLREPREKSKSSSRQIWAGRLPICGANSVSMMRSRVESCEMSMVASMRLYIVLTHLAWLSL